METVRVNELRVGNWLNWYSTYHCNGYFDKQLEIEDFTQTDLSSARPIPLTEEWLLKFGFEKADEIYFIEFDVYSMTIKEYEKGNYILNPETHFNYVDIKYVHQLQNLYFALTGEELEINN